jgi:hypothetical protein
MSKVTIMSRVNASSWAPPTHPPPHELEEQPKKLVSQLSQLWMVAAEHFDASIPLGPTPFF